MPPGENFIYLNMPPGENFINLNMPLGPGENIIT